MSLDRFDPALRAWFEGRFGAPTPVQQAAWGPIAAGEHALVVAPTGSGKTLTAFLWAIDRLATGAWECGTTRLLYVSPLKALNADIERNLVEPLAGIRAAFAAAGREMPAIRVAVRSGDTPPAERQRILRRRPEVLITTPESLNLLLLARGGEALLSGLRCVILDEVHAVAGTKRGTHLITAVDRLVPLCGELQRLAVSATARPLEAIAAWVGGYRLERGAGGDPRYVARPVRVVEVPRDKRYDVAVRRAMPALEGEEGSRTSDALWTSLAEEMRARIAESRSTLVFTNSRRTAEKMTRFLNESAGRELSWSHHGSLARELRTAVEQRLKEGKLPAIVATSSLELGIDIGALDRVLLLQSPRSLASAAQRVGRAGHQVGEVSRAIFYPLFPRDYLDCAVAARAVLEGEIEPVVPPRAPLDVLAQVLLALVAHDVWRVDDLYDFVRASAPYHELPRRLFDLLIDMLAGRYAEARLPELKPRIAFDRLDGTVRARPGVARLLAQSGGTIPDRGYFQMRLVDSRARLGELDEEFVWERAIGDTFTLGAQSWRIQQITAHEVLVSPARGGASLAPFWRADARDRGSHFSRRVARLLAELEAASGDDGAARELLTTRHALEPAAAAELLALLRAEREALGCALPHERHLVVEECPVPGEGREHLPGRTQTLLYTFWGGTVNRPLALALVALWEEETGEPLEAQSDDDAVLLLLPAGADPERLLRAIDPERLEELLRRRLEGSGYFGARFRQNAQRSLLLPRATPGRRTPLWLSRENAKRLLAATAGYDDFPLTVETWRECLQDDFELAELRDRLTALREGEIRISRVRTERPSPFAANLVWRRVNELMYEDDVPVGRNSGASLRPDLVREVAFTAADRPRFAAPLVARYREKVQRLLPGYPPLSASELLEWLKERVLLTEAEWAELLAAIERDAPGFGAAAAEELERDGKLAWLRSATGRRCLAAREIAPRLAAAAWEHPGPVTPGAAGALFEEWLRLQPPRTRAELAELWGPPERLEALVAPVVASGRAVEGELLESDRTPRIATVEAVATLLRWRRAAARPELEALPLSELARFRAAWQGLAEPAADGGALPSRMERLFGFPAPAALWESDLLPARFEHYQPAWLDALLRDSELTWFGGGERRVAFAFSGDLDLFVAPQPEAPTEDAARLLALLGERPRGAELAELADLAGFDSGRTLAALWQLVWRGEATHEELRALRQGIAADFATPAPVAARRSVSGERAPGRRALFRRWQEARPFAGRWLPLLPARTGADPLAEEERQRERARLLLDRHGVLFRELLAPELPSLSWARLARSLRALELGGEIVTGHFFAGVPGLQFATPAAVRRLQENPVEGGIWWCSALDPVALCGVDLPELKGALPRRVPSNHLVYRGSRLALVSRRGGRELEFLVPPSDPGLAELVRPLDVALTRAVAPVPEIEVERINGSEAERSAYREACARISVTREMGRLRLRRSYRS